MTTRRRSGDSLPATDSTDALSEYVKKRNFEITSEPRGSIPVNNRAANAARSPALSFTIQKHHARNLHYDFRLEIAGTLKSWAVPKGPSLDPGIKRLAVHVEDHPLDYGTFEGTIPKGEYGAGEVILWDKGEWIPDGDPEKAYRDGKLSFVLKGSKLGGAWNLFRTRFKGDKSGNQWLLIKEDDELAIPANEYDVTEMRPESVSQLQPDTAAKSQGDKSQEAKSKTKKSAIPKTLKPQLATPMQHLPAGEWLYEIKLDGYRLLARILKGQVTLFTRSGQDWTHKLPRLVEAVARMGQGDSWLDGEIVVLDDNGLPDFHALQNAFESGSNSDIIYYLFDAPFLDGHDLRNTGLTQRRDALGQVLARTTGDILRFSAAFDGHDFRDVYESACAMSLEGVIAKRIGSHYRSLRSPDWVKLKCLQRQEFVIVGYTDPEGSRSGFGALLLGTYKSINSNELNYAGRVGTGFNEAGLKKITSKLKPLVRKDSPLDERVAVSPGVKINWVAPVLVCEVEFTALTPNNRVRHAVFVSLRDDKPASEVVLEQREKPMVVSGAPTSVKGDGKVAGIVISSPDRVIDSDTGYHKIQLAEFYDAIGDWIILHLKCRPVSLLRAPDGVEGEHFFQKHDEHISIAGINHLPVELDPGHAPLMEIDSRQGLAGAVQMGAIEFHTWGATKKSIENPDRIILDLDPDPELPWKAMIEATQLVLSVLDEIGLEAYLKTSGGKGMHIVIPIARTLDWTDAKSFAKAISSFMRHQLPDRFSDKMGPQNRIGKIFVDYLRNSRGASTVSAYSVRARPGLPVSVPIQRKELVNVTSAGQWTVLNLHKRLDALQEDPWAGYSHRQRITQKMFSRLKTRTV